MPTRTKIPIVYVRGFAGDTSGIDKAVKDPFYGFNEGSTHVRVGAGNEPSFHQFESPLLRLLLDDDYRLLVEGGQDAYLNAHDSIPANSIWVLRFYDVSASTWGSEPKEFRIEDAAADLLSLIDKIRAKSGADHVHLVAHSMGGLVCRCLLQKLLPDLGRDPADCVDKVFTYGSPHGGITFDAGFGLFEKVRDATGLNGAEIFGPKRMYEYLTPKSDYDPQGRPSEWRARDMPARDAAHPKAFPHPRVFCLVGTDPTDYDVAFGLSAAAVGPRSDGLVQIENAYVPGAHRAFVHRSHSGRYGLVNSEEGYQNLRRFLFGDRKVEATLADYRLPPEEGTTWQAEVRMSVRGLPIVIHEQTAEHWCPLQLPPSDALADIPLTSTFLCTGLRPQDGHGTMRYAMHLRILSLHERRGFMNFGDHLEQTADFDDILVIDVGQGTWAAWNSVIPGSIRDHDPSGTPLADVDSAEGRWVASVPLPDSAKPILGDQARIRLTVTPWE
ncbi:esterase/lipase family protein [Streptomyces sp. NPDC058620]|uniref:esterase/lipase family protein n=1 Tax=Streptomyces sp. NPDC058620 TaxID=3346560 RepID=UPI00364729AA